MATLTRLERTNAEVQEVQSDLTNVFVQSQGEAAWCRRWVVGGGEVDDILGEWKHAGTFHLVDATNAGIGSVVFAWSIINR